jgi:hypothetical protein
MVVMGQDLLAKTIEFFLAGIAPERFELPGQGRIGCVERFVDQLVVPRQAGNTTTAHGGEHQSGRVH